MPAGDGLHARKADPSRAVWLRQTNEQSCIRLWLYHEEPLFFRPTNPVDVLPAGNDALHPSTSALAEAGQAGPKDVWILKSRRFRRPEFNRKAENEALVRLEPDPRFDVFSACPSSEALGANDSRTVLQHREVHLNCCLRRMNDVRKVVEMISQFGLIQPLSGRVGRISVLGDQVMIPTITGGTAGLAMTPSYRSSHKPRTLRGGHGVHGHERCSLVSECEGTIIRRHGTARGASFPEDGANPQRERGQSGWRIVPPGTMRAAEARRNDFPFSMKNISLKHPVLP